jgi:hypothetical protein
MRFFALSPFFTVFLSKTPFFYQKKPVLHTKKHILYVKTPHFLSKKKRFSYQKHPFSYQKHPFSYQKTRFSYRKHHFSYQKPPRCGAKPREALVILRCDHSAPPKQPKLLFATEPSQCVYVLKKMAFWWLF